MAGVKRLKFLRGAAGNYEVQIAAQARVKELCEHLKWHWTPSRPLTSRWMKSDNLTRAPVHLLRATCATVKGLGDQSLKCPIKMTANVKLEELSADLRQG